MKTNKLYIASLCLGASLTFGSCDSFLDIDAPKDQVAADLAFADAKVAEAAMVGVYTSMNNFNNQFASALLSLVLASASDDYYSAFTTYDEYKLNTITPNTSYLDRLWSQPYGYINHCNKIIEGLAVSPLTDAVKKQFTAEARFVRAFNYFYLTNLFNKVPLVTTSDINISNTLGPSSKEEVYAFIINELKLAETDLADAYPTSERTRPNKKAVSALLARVYLYHQDWSAAEKSASDVIGDTRYKLLDNLNDVFLRTSNEAIWQLQTVNTSTAGVNTWEGFTIVPAQPTARAYYNIYDATLASYEANDKRKENWLKPYTTGGKTFFMPFKYKVRTNAPVLEYNMVLRFAEQYLIRSEALLKQGKTKEAITDLNQIRKRAGLTLLDENTPIAQVTLALEKDRHLELLGEWGHRWFDLVRTNRAVPVLSQTKGNFEAADQRIPIAASVLLTNPKLEQND